MRKGESLVILAGATGRLGGGIARGLRERGAIVRAIVRLGAAPGKAEGLKRLGASVVEVDFADRAALAEACAGASCVVSALAGLRDVIIGAQGALLDAAVAASVPRFMPSDYSIDFTKLPPGTNRNLDLRRDFHALLARAPIAATTIFNGAFADLLTGQAPLVLFKVRRVAYWGDADQRMDFTAVDDVAAFAAAAALDPATPRFLRVAGDEVSARGLASAASEATGRRFRLLRAGGLGRLEALTKITRALLPETDEVYPAWQGMQYLHGMFDGRAKLAPLDNDRYPGLRWAGAREVLARRRGAAPA